MKYQFRSKSVIALILCTVLVLGMMPISVGAEEETSTEVISLREENVKHFDMGDGTYQAVVYAHPVHELDSQGKWQDIDFGLNFDQTKKVETYTSEGSGMAFAASYTENNTLLTLFNEGDSISMSLVVSPTTATVMTANTAVAAKVTEADTDIKTFEEATNAKFTNTVLYENVLPGIDLEYIADPYMIKENIIVREQMSSYSYTFQLDLNGLYPKLTDEGCVIICDLETDGRKYEIARPYMYDDLGNMSEAVFYTLQESKGNYYLTVAADTGWINEKDRKFPVTIDPSFSLTESDVDDTCIISTQADSALGGIHNLWIREDRTTYIKPNTTFCPPNGHVLMEAKLVGYYYYYDYVNSGSVLVSAHRVVKPWSENALNWNIANTWTNQGLVQTALDYQRAHGVLLPRVDSPAKIEFNITEAAQGWANGRYSNYGIGLRYESGSNLSVIIKSSETGTTYSPRFIYKYGYDYYYTSFYDSTMDGETYRISRAIETSNAAFSNLFGLYFAEGVTAYDGTLTDACPNDPNAPCGDYYDCGDNHHKDVFSIHNELSNRIEDARERIVFWTDHGPATYCNHDNENNECVPLELTLEDENARFIAFNNLGTPIIHMLNMLPHNASEDVFEACMGINLIHETAHTFGMDDVYGENDHDVDGWCCVMESYQADGEYAEDLVAFYQDIQNKDCSAFCNRCAVALRSYL